MRLETTLLKIACVPLEAATNVVIYSHSRIALLYLMVIRTNGGIWSMLPSAAIMQQDLFSGTDVNHLHFCWKELYIGSYKKVIGNIITIVQDQCWSAFVKMIIVAIDHEIFKQALSLSRSRAFSLVSNLSCFQCGDIKRANTTAEWNWFATQTLVSKSRSPCADLQQRTGATSSHFTRWWVWWRQP